METRPEIIVLSGGISPERGISIATGTEVFRHLDRERWSVRPAVILQDGNVRHAGADSGEDVASLEAGGGRHDHLLDAFREWEGEGIASVFLALHGSFGEDGLIQGALHCAGLRYTGSGVAASAICMDKIFTRSAVADLGCPVAPAMALHRRAHRSAPRAILDAICADEGTGLPCFVKPANGGSSLGLARAANRDELARALEEAFNHDARVLVEQAVGGTELSCGVLGNAEDDELLVLEPVEIRPRQDGFFSYEEKYADEGAIELCPSESAPPETVTAVQRMAERIHRGLGLRAMSRTDFIASGTGLVVLEVNTIPGLTPRSILPRAARVAGLDFTALLTRILEDSTRGEP